MNWTAEFYRHSLTMKEDICGVVLHWQVTWAWVEFHNLVSIGHNTIHWVKLTPIWHFQTRSTQHHRGLWFTIDLAIDKSCTKNVVVDKSRPLRQAKAKHNIWMRSKQYLSASELFINLRRLLINNKSLLSPRKQTFTQC